MREKMQGVKTLICSPYPITSNPSHTRKGGVFIHILVLAYAVALGNAFTSDAVGIDNFPALGPGMVALLGISHAGYLVHKAAPHSQTG